MGEWPELYDDTDAGFSADVSKVEAEEVMPGMLPLTLLSMAELE